MAFRQNSKRGQIVLFFLMGMLFVFFIAIALLLRGSADEGDMDSSAREGLSMSLDLRPVQNYLNSILEQRLTEAFLLAGIQGGYIYPDGEDIFEIDNGTYLTQGSDFIVYEGVKVPVYATGMDGSFPSKEEILGKIKRYVLVKFMEDVDPGMFKNIGLKLKLPDVDYSDGYYDDENVGIDLIMGGSSVLAVLNFPVEVKRREVHGWISQVKAEVPVRLNTTYSIALGALDEALADWSTGNKFMLKDLDCDALDEINRTVIYQKDHPTELGVKVIRVIDFNYPGGYVFQYALDDPPFGIEGRQCRVSFS